MTSIYNFTMLCTGLCWNVVQDILECETLERRAVLMTLFMIIVLALLLVALLFETVAVAVVTL